MAKNKLIRTVTSEEGKAIIDQLIKDAGAKKLKKPDYKKGTWYMLPDGREFGVRKTTSMASARHNVEWNIDVEQLKIGLEKIKILREKR